MTRSVCAAWPFHRPAPPPPGPAPWWAIWAGGIAHYANGAWTPRPGAFSFWLGEDG